MKIFVITFLSLAVVLATVITSPRCGTEVTGRLAIAHSFMLAGCPPRPCRFRGGDIDIGGLVCE